MVHGFIFVFSVRYKSELYIFQDVQHVLSNHIFYYVGNILICL